MEGKGTNETATVPEEYESYTETCKVYDQRRVAIGLNYVKEAIEKVMQCKKKERSNIVLLDAGCGTGNYIFNLSKCVGKVIGFDYNEGMLKQCRQKCSQLKNVSLIHGSLLEKLPLKDASVDVIVINQVLHHIAGSKKYENTAHLLGEFSRVLKTGGAVIINTQDPEQHMKGFWWAEIIPIAAKKLADRLIPVKDLVAMMEKCKLCVERVEIPPQPLMRYEKYIDASGPFNEAYRNGDSTWSLATNEELEAGLKRYKMEIYDAGKAEAYIKELEAVRAKVGQTTSIVAFRRE